MNSGWRSTVLFAAGSVAGGAAVLAAYLGWFAPGEAFSPTPSRLPAYVATAEPQPVVAVPTQTAGAAAASCPVQALAERSGGQDGQFVLDAALASRSHPDPAAFVAVAREAAEQGRVRDAEVALIAACHVAEQSAGGSSAPLADVKSQLGQHYVALAAREEDDAPREALLQRAGALFSESASAYAAALGKDASKTRMAEQRLASVREPTTLQIARQSPTAVLGAARPSLQEDAAFLAGPRSGAVRGLIESDPQLAQLEHDMQRLRAQAGSVSRDRAGMRQRDAYALAQRDARCGDRACLLNWYAQRRAQLLDEF